MLSLDPNITQNKKLLKDKVNNKSYIRGKLLGTGGFAKAYQAIDQDDGRLYAAKVIPKKSINEKRQRYKLLIEIKIHKGLKHKHIVQFIQAFEDKQNIYILLQYCRNYTLKDLVKRRKRLTQHQTRMYVSQVVKALIYIHQQGIIHRDLKLGNILINDQMEAKICDFGLSTRIKAEGQVKKTICGTPNYIAPQILQENGHSYQVDIWSIGVIMFTLLFGKPPFQDNTVQQTYENIKNNRYVFPAQIPCTLAAKDLINRILVMDPAKRLGLQEILEHQFMQIPQGVPSSLPVSSLAVPPLFLDKLPTRLNLNDIHLQLSQQIQGDDDQTSGLVADRLKASTDSTSNLKMEFKKKQNYVLPFIAIKQIFKYEQCYGYLLTNGIVGMFIKKIKVNLILQFGQQHYYLLEQGKKPQKQPIPSQNDQSPQIQRLLHFKSFYNQKYSLFKLQQMNKRSPQPQNQKVLFLSKCFNLTESQIMTRLSNSVIQIHFPDFTTLIINRNDQKGIFYINQKGKASQINYNQCKSSKLKTKIRRFSNIIQKLSSAQQQAEQEDQQYEQQNSKQPYDQEQDDLSKE